MSQPTLAANQRVYRLDKFIVPQAARDEFLAKVKSTHQLLRSQPGFVQGFLLEQSLPEDVVKIATLVEWESQQAINDARVAVMAMHQRHGFSAQEFIARLGIKAEVGSYHPIPT